MSMTPEEKRARKAERNRRYREANKSKLAEKDHRYRESRKEKIAERKRLYYEANKEKIAEKDRQYHESNKEKRHELHRKYREANNQKFLDRKRRHYATNKEKLTEIKRRCNRRKSFNKEDGSSFEAWLASLHIRNWVFKAIANLQPDPGQTLTELIHELSGYAMEVCEQIANPPVIEDPQPTQPTPQPDLF
jgi:hypothetical protein